MQKNLLLGGGEKLTSSSEIKRGPPNKKWPYHLDEIRSALKDPLASIQDNLSAIDQDAKPRNEGVFELTLHPAFLGRSYYPTAALAKSGLRDIGSKEVEIVPRTATRDERQGKQQATATLFVAGTKQDIERFSTLLFSEKLPENIRRDFVKIETVRWIEPEDKIKGNLPEAASTCAFEVALHAGADEDDIVAAFATYAKKHNGKPDLQRRIRVGGLTFLPVEASPSVMRKLAQFSFLRVARPMADIRIAIPQAVRHTFHSDRPGMPIGPAMESSVKAAIFDGGLGTHDLSPWSREITYAETTDTLGELLLHGNEVTSTFLFGRQGSSKNLARPFMNVDHYRVLGPASGRDPDLFDVLHRIKNALDTGDYRFANLSLGPRMPVDDDDVHAWTATLDQICARHGILATVAVGNDGDIEGACRIQPPSDMVNAIAVGSANSSGKKWARAPYSCIGPGRSPGVVKPDGLAFGGSDTEPFKVFNPLLGHVVGVQGTSYAAPLTLRSTAGIFTSTTYDMSAIALKALLVHRSEKKRGGVREEIGWGRFMEDSAQIIECDPHSATIIFQGLLCKGEYRRCPIPLPDVAITKSLTISATLCIQPHTDPEHPVNYTRAGMGVKFRPQNGLGETQTSDFFGLASQYKSTEREQRDGAHKWETCLHRTKTFKDGSTIVDPVFDIEYHARQASRGIPLKSAPDVKYALVVSVSAEEIPDIYDLIRQRFPVLTPVELRNEIQVDNQLKT